MIHSLSDITNKFSSKRWNLNFKLLTLQQVKISKFVLNVTETLSHKFRGVSTEVPLTTLRRNISFAVPKKNMRVNMKLGTLQKII